MPTHPGRHRERRNLWALLQLSGIGMLVASAITLGLVVSAGAAGPASGDIVPGSAVPIGTVAHAPFDSGQLINVVIPANSAFAAPDNTANVNIVECSAPAGVPPTNPIACDGNTIQGSTILPAADGSFTSDNYQVFALPDNFTLGEGSSGPICGNTSGTECILYIGNNQNDFTKPHLWSQPFFVGPGRHRLGEPAGRWFGASGGDGARSRLVDRRRLAPNGNGGRRRSLHRDRDAHREHHFGSGARLGQDGHPDLAVVDGEDQRTVAAHHRCHREDDLHGDRHRRRTRDTDRSRHHGHPQRDGDPETDRDLPDSGGGRRPTRR